MTPAELDADRIPGPVRAVLARLREAGHAAHLVGGCVRDLSRGRTSHDFDVTTPAPPDAVLALFPRAVPTGLRHGTVMVPTSSGPVDVTRYRRGPKLEDDLACRDFTI
nr:tRNA nucleotidyltransferase [Actinomycetota bacterium]NIU70225.1 tRNA nucleotidyltransferase [Actinomycetota bacterium]NIW32111.1 tRNA nucleotidyltransferase [Actinomycetota bacterium]NIX24343.1 tRNA nucleotidyltransferase [Actinomycetota bacterium]